MNRENKYRVWDRLCEVMIYPDEITFDMNGGLVRLAYTDTEGVVNYITRHQITNMGVPLATAMSGSGNLMKMKDGTERFVTM